jgi:hypothetical protein
MDRQLAVATQRRIPAALIGQRLPSRVEVAAVVTRIMTPPADDGLREIVPVLDDTALTRAVRRGETDPDVLAMAMKKTLNLALGVAVGPCVMAGAAGRAFAFAFEATTPAGYTYEEQRSFDPFVLAWPAQIITRKGVSVPRIETALAAQVNGVRAMLAGEWLRAIEQFQRFSQTLRLWDDAEADLLDTCMAANIALAVKFSHQEQAW